MSVHRALDGFIGPKDIFRNPESIFRFFEPTDGDAPFDLVLSHSGSDFAVMGMHFKVGLYEHQSAGALQGLLQRVQQDQARRRDQPLARMARNDHQHGSRGPVITPGSRGRHPD